MKQLTEREALSRLAAECSKAEHSRGEIVQKMVRWGIDSDACQRIVDYLVKNNYINDVRYVHAFVNDKLKYDHWGRRKIEQALRQKQVDGAVIDSTLDAVSDEQWTDVLRPVLRKKWPTIKAATDYERSMKLIKYALGRGFTIDIIRQCIDHADEIIDE